MNAFYRFVAKNIAEIRLFFLYGFFLSSFFTPLAIYFGNKLNIVDKPEREDGSEKIHKMTIPRSGGIAIYLSMIVLLLIIGNYTRQFLGIFLGATAIFAGMLIDDRKALSFRMKFLIQFIAAFIAIASGIRFTSITIPFSNYVIQFGFFGVILTAIWIVGVINAVNIIDGLDGLASGVATIAAFSLSIVSMYKGHIEIALLLLGISGVLLAFLIYNFHPARIFLGDSGAELVGFLLGTISVVGAYKTAALFSIAVPILILGVPVSEVFTSIIRRLISGNSPFKYDTEHIHYKLLRLGWSQRKIAFLYYFITALLSFIGIGIAFGAR
jgi:UDP-GlcNAc:undecaprenyl-phosphate GlcNAc-1-phosphate transferase